MSKSIWNVGASWVIVETYYVVLSDLAVRIIVLRDSRHLESDLDETPREIPNGDELA